MISPYCIFNETGCKIKVEHELSEKDLDLPNQKVLKPVFIKPCQRENFQVVSNIKQIFSLDQEAAPRNKVSVKILSQDNFSLVKGIDLDRVRTRVHNLYSSFSDESFLLTSRVTLDKNQKVLTIGSAIVLVNKTARNFLIKLYKKEKVSEIILAAGEKEYVPIDLIQSVMQISYFETSDY